MDNRIVEKLQKVLALTKPSDEGEAQAAAAMLARLLAQHNLEIADLEKKGQAAPGVEEKDVDLGKAAWQWKQNLADRLAEHYFCISLRRGKNPVFVGRPDNVEALKMLFAWLVEQVAGIAREERRVHAAKTGEHVDPLRWNLHFGLGAVERLGERLDERRKKEQSTAGTALVVSHETEANDYLEKKYGWRQDGRRTKKQQEEADRSNALLAELDALKASDIEAYYKRCPWDRPLTDEETAKREAESAKRRAEDDKRWKRQRARDEARREREWMKQQTPEGRRKRLQQEQADEAGRAAGDRVNLEPFIEKDEDNIKGQIGGDS